MAENRTIDDILQELNKNYKSVLLEAVKNATDTAVEDVYKFSMSVLDRYYENYMPSRYERTDSLQHAIIPIAEVKSNNNTIISTVGVEFNASVLESYISRGDLYNGSAKYGKADSQWVIENYLLGIHPATDGSRIPGEAVYIPWQDPISPHSYMDRYLKLYKNRLNNNVFSNLIAYIAK